jgi:predicted nucleic acid-binding protein
MSEATVDASVWIAAQDPSDLHCQDSRAFLSKALELQTAIHVPAYAVVEVACALARRLRDGAKGRLLAQSIFSAASARETAVDARMISKALNAGTDKFLRGADALYAATASMTGSQLISWDKEHLQRASGMTPVDWVASRP